MDYFLKSVKEQFLPWINCNKKDIYDKLNDIYNKKKERLMLVKLTFTKEGVKMDNSHLQRFWKIRSEAIYILFKNIKSKKQFDLYFTVHDYNIVKTLPVLCFAKPINENGILIPDWTFTNSYKSKIKEGWEETIKELNSIKNIKKIDKVFFQGGNTSTTDVSFRANNRTNIRKYFEEFSEGDDKFIIKLDKPYNSVKEWKKYKYLLDLPGAHPWSVRFKELLLMRSVVIKVDTVPRWINFYSSLLTENVDYISIPLERGNNKKRAADIAYEQVKVVVDEMDKNVNMYKKVSDNGYKKIKLLNKELIDRYLELVIENYENIFL